MDRVGRRYCCLRSIKYASVLRQAVDFVRERLQQGEPPRAVCAALCDHCLAPNTEGCGKGCGKRHDRLCIIGLMTRGQPPGRAPVGAE